jgi:MFS family permease
MTQGLKDFAVNYFLNDVRSHPPLLPLLSAIFLKPNGTFNANLLIYTSLIWSLFILSVYLIASFFLNRRDRYLVLVFTIFCPIIFSLSHRILADVLLAFFTTFAIFILLKYVEKQKISYLVFAGFVASLGFLTKPTAPIFLAGPFVFALFTGRTRYRVYLYRFLFVFFGFSFLGLTWAVPNFTNLIAYFQNQNVFPDEMYVLVPENAGSLSALWQYCFELIKLLGLPAIVFFVIGTLRAMTKLVGFGKKGISVRKFRLDSSWLLISSAVFPALIFFGLSKFWEFRYIIPVLPFIFVMIAKLVYFIKFTKFQSMFLIPIILISALPFYNNSDPQTWSPSYQKAFYGNKTKTTFTNSYFLIARSGLEPRVSMDRSLHFLSFLRANYPTNRANVNVLIPFSHPELNEVSLNWASSFFKEKYIFREISFREIKGKKIVDSTNEAFLRRIQCADIIVLPDRLPIERTPYKDIVDWRNHNLSQVNNLGGVIKLTETKIFNASKLRAVATVESIPFVIGRLSFDLVNIDNYASEYCASFMGNTINSTSFALKG